MARVEAPRAAVAFLTRVPLGPLQPLGDEALSRAAPLFPLVGAAIGAAVAGSALGGVQFLPAAMAGLLAVAVELILTGALHADGLADSADGLGGGDRERSLAIMRDHAIGAYGACALIVVLGLKAAALGALAEAGASGWVVAAFALSRSAPLPLGHLLPYARRSGVGALLAGRLATGPAALGVGLGALVALVAAGAVAALALLAAAAVATVLVGLMSKRRLGGVTGDVMGAAVELSATLCLVVAVALHG
jgi:adenosylcobinamide-GDP ribazoletransferase